MKLFLLNFLLFFSFFSFVYLFYLPSKTSLYSSRIYSRSSISRLPSQVKIWRRSSSYSSLFMKENNQENVNNNNKVINDDNLEDDEEEEDDEDEEDDDNNNNNTKNNSIFSISKSLPSTIRSIRSKKFKKLSKASRKQNELESFLLSKIPINYNNIKINLKDFLLSKEFRHQFYQQNDEEKQQNNEKKNQIYIKNNDFFNFYSSIVTNYTNFLLNNPKINEIILKYNKIIEENQKEDEKLYINNKQNEFNFNFTIVNNNELKEFEDFFHDFDEQNIKITQKLLNDLIDSTDINKRKKKDKNIDEKNEEIKVEGLDDSIKEVYEVDINEENEEFDNILNEENEESVSEEDSDELSNKIKEENELEVEMIKENDKKRRRKSKLNNVNEEDLVLLTSIYEKMFPSSTNNTVLKQDYNDEIKTKIIEEKENIIDNYKIESKIEDNEENIEEFFFKHYKPKELSQREINVLTKVHENKKFNFFFNIMILKNSSIPIYIDSSTSSSLNLSIGNENSLPYISKNYFEYSKFLVNYFLRHLGKYNNNIGVNYIEKNIYNISTEEENAFYNSILFPHNFNNSDNNYLNFNSDKLKFLNYEDTLDNGSKFFNKKIIENFNQNDLFKLEFSNLLFPTSLPNNSVQINDNEIILLIWFSGLSNIPIVNSIKFKHIYSKKFLKVLMNKVVLNKKLYKISNMLNNYYNNIYELEQFFQHENLPPNKDFEKEIDKEIENKVLFEINKDFPTHEFEVKSPKDENDEDSIISSYQDEMDVDFDPDLKFDDKYINILID